MKWQPNLLTRDTAAKEQVHDYPLEENWCGKLWLAESQTFVLNTGLVHATVVTDHEGYPKTALLDSDSLAEADDLQHMRFIQARFPLQVGDYLVECWMQPKARCFDLMVRQVVKVEAQHAKMRVKLGFRNRRPLVRFWLMLYRVTRHPALWDAMALCRCKAAAPPAKWAAYALRQAVPTRKMQMVLDIEQALRSWQLPMNQQQFDLQTAVFHAALTEHLTNIEPDADPYWRQVYGHSFD